jgi:hypothetical protein
MEMVVASALNYNPNPWDYIVYDKLCDTWNNNVIDLLY